MDPTGRFSGRETDYARFRPSYPAEAISSIMSGLTSAGLTCADVGAGTGISSRLLAERGMRVIAVEPNAAMRAAASPHHCVEFREGTAEATGLECACVDLILCAQAFHWFNPAQAIPEFHRILRPGGRLALMWNDRDAHDPCTSGYGLLVRHAGKFHAASEDSDLFTHALHETPLFANVRLRLFRYHQSLTLEGLIGRANSASYVPKHGPRHDALVEGLKDLHRRFADTKGVVSLTYITRVYLADRNCCGG
jgi:SAM-dependent methyltransferase